MGGRRSALIVATSTYEDARLTPLRGPAHDARTLEHVLSDPAIGGFDVHVLEDESKGTIEQELEAFFDQRAREDLLLLYFSGHGITTAAPQRSYFFATRTTRTDRLRSTGIAAGYVNDLMRLSRARQKVLLVDCCHGGAFKWDMIKAGPSSGLLESFHGDNAPGTGMAVITASQATQYALLGESTEGGPVQSVFTSVLVDGLTTGAADVNADGHVSLDELYDYLREKATTASQSPELNVVGRTGQILVARNPHPSVRPATLPAETQQALHSDTWWLRKGAVDALASYLDGDDPALALAARLALEPMVEDPDRRVSSLAASALAEIPETGLTAWRKAREEQARVTTTDPDRRAGERPERTTAEELEHTTPERPDRTTLPRPRQDTATPERQDGAVVQRKVRFLTDDWARLLTEAINADDDAVHAMAGVRVITQVHVTGGPNGDRAYYLRVDGGRATVGMGEIADADIVSSGTYEDEVRDNTMSLGKNLAQSFSSQSSGSISKGKWKVIRHMAMFYKVGRAILSVAPDVEF